MMRLLKTCPVVALLVGAAMLGTANRARANIELDLQEDSGPIIVVNIPADTGPVTYTGPVGADFTVTASFGASNSPGTGVLAKSQAGTLDILNTDGAAGHTLHLSVSAQDFTKPQNPPDLIVLDTVSGSLVSGHVDGTWQGFADATNVLETLTTGSSGFSAPLLPFAATGTAVSFLNNGQHTGFEPNGASYSLSAFATFNLGAGAELTLTGGNTEVAPVPAPTNLVLGSVALLGLTGVYFLRRRTALVLA
jgi:hypothetical protein